MSDSELKPAARLFVCAAVLPVLEMHVWGLSTLACLAGVALGLPAEPGSSIFSTAPRFQIIVHDEKPLWDSEEADRIKALPFTRMVGASGVAVRNCLHAQAPAGCSPRACTVPVFPRRQYR